MFAALWLETDWFEDPQGALERRYLEDYLQSKGHSLRTVWRLERQAAHKLMREACLYASLRLAEKETRAHLLREMHGQG